MAHTWVDGEEITAAKLNDIENAIKGVIDGGIFEVTSNKVTSIDENSTAQTYPNAKAVYNLFNNIANGEVKRY